MNTGRVNVLRFFWFTENKCNAMCLRKISENRDTIRQFFPYFYK